MQLSIIAGIGINNELGNNNGLLWQLPNDLKHFKDTTTGHPIIMGRRTFDSIGRPLPNRTNIVITRDAGFNADGIVVAHSFEEAIAPYKQTDQEIFIIGGGQLYAETLPYADKLYITKVNGSFDADVFFPAINPDEWKVVSTEAHGADERHAYAYTFVVLEKI